MTDVNINITGVGLESDKKYLLEARRGDITYEGLESLRKSFKDNNIDVIIVVSETGNALNVVEIPEGKSLEEVAEELA